MNQWIKNAISKGKTINIEILNEIYENIFALHNKQQKRCIPLWSITLLHCAVLQQTVFLVYPNHDFFQSVGGKHSPNAHLNRLA